MPLYEYECQKCRHRFERIQKFSDPPAKKCPECGGKVEQLISAPAVQFKGSGWYVTDYARKGASSKAAESGDGAGTASAKTEKDGAPDKADAGGKAEDKPAKAKTEHAPKRGRSKR